MSGYRPDPTNTKLGLAIVSYFHQILVTNSHKPSQHELANTYSPILTQLDHKLRQSNNELLAAHLNSLYFELQLGGAELGLGRFDKLTSFLMADMEIDAALFVGVFREAERLGEFRGRVLDLLLAKINRFI